MADPILTALIRQGSRRRRLDPAAVLAVGMVEGGLRRGAIGDRGTSFGTFQLHRGGALPAGRGLPWADSPAGINYTLDRIAQVAGGLRGRAAVNAIVRRFERPAAPGQEVAKALGNYGKIGGGSAAVMTPAARPVLDNRSSASPGSSPARPQIDLTGLFNFTRSIVGLPESPVSYAQTLPPRRPTPPGTRGLPQRQRTPKLPGFQVHGAYTPRDKQAVATAQRYLGTNYVWGGSSPQTGFDCSGLLQYVWGQQGVKIPRVTYDQWNAGTAVAKKDLRPGDAVFFRPGPRGPEHVGMYIGGGKFIEAPGRGKVVRISRLAGHPQYMGARHYG